MINLQKIKLEKCHPPPPPPPLRRPASAPYFHLLFLFFRFPSPPLGEVFKIYSPLPLKKKGWGVRTMQKRWGAKLVDVIKHLCHKVFLL